MTSILRASLIFTLAWITSAPAQETMIRQVFDTATDTHVEVLSLFSQPSHGGFLPVRVKIANNRPQDHRIRLDFTSQSGYNAIQGASSFELSAAAGTTLTRDLLVPLTHGPQAHQHYQNVEVRLTGSLGNGGNHNIQCHSDRTQPAVLLSNTLAVPNASELDAAVTKKAGSRYGNTHFATRFDPAQAPTEWLAYSGHDSVLMTDSDWTRCPAAARHAITSWVRLGGQLVVFSSTASNPEQLGLPLHTGFGSCRVEDIASSLKLNPSETLALVSSRNEVRRRVPAINSDYKSSWPLQQQFGSEPFRFGTFLVVLFLFAILVGPINLFVFAKSGQRHRLFVTTPLISLGASLVLVALIIAQDGFGGRGQRRVLMQVLPADDSHAAYLHQEQFSRSGIIARSRFTLQPACLIDQVPIKPSRWARFTDNYRTQASLNLQPAGGSLLASGDWWQSRSEQGQALSAVIPTRGRIETTATPGTLVSTFAFPLDSIYLLDEKRQWHRAENITTGKPFHLTPVSRQEAETTLTREAHAFAPRNRQLLTNAALRPNHYVALTHHAPAIETLPGIKWQQTDTVITGNIK